MRLAPSLRRWTPRGALLAALALAGCSEQLPTESVLEPEGGPRADAAHITPTLQATKPGHIRIGVVPSATSVKLGSDGAFAVRDKATGQVLVQSGSGGEVTVELDGIAQVRERDWMQAICTGLTSRRDQLIQQGTAAGFEARFQTVLRSNGTVLCYRILYGSLPARSSAADRSAFQARAAAAGLPNSGIWQTITDVLGETRLKLTHAGGTAFATHPVVLTAEGGIVRIAGVRYRGEAEVWLNSSNALAGINEVRFEQYLYGVVPRELPPTIWDELEAQKAQAVAARTYARSGMGKRRADGYDLLATTSDQVYGGYDAEHPLSTQAVDATRGVVATYNGSLIQALFSSTNGGHSAGNEEVYESAPIPYLRPVMDTHRGQAHEHVPTLDVFKKAPLSASLRSFRGNDHEAHWSRYHRWNFEWTAREIRDVLSAWKGIDVGRVRAINVLERGASGRVTRIEYVTDAGTFTDTKDRIRSSLKFVTASGTRASLLSTLFFIEPVLDRRTGEVEGFRAYGGGWGHGVGLSQTGAVGMAQRGATYQEILKHYYQGIELSVRE